MFDITQSAELNSLQAWKESGSPKAAELIVALMAEQLKKEQENSVLTRGKNEKK